MATRKFRKSRSRKTVRRKPNRKTIQHKPNRKTVRRHITSTAGKILSPLDVRSNIHLKEFEKRIKSGALTIILVWAPWCPHCHTLMPHFDSASKSPNRSIQTIKVQDTMLPAVNEILKSNINKNVKPINVEGYPSIIVVDKNGNKVTDIEPVRNTESLTKLMDNAGSLAKEAGLNTSDQNMVKASNSLKDSLNSNNINKNKNTNKNNNKNNKNNNNLLTNIGVENEGLSAGIGKNSPKNFDVGEEELKGSLYTPNKNIKLNSSTNISKDSIAPSPINSFNNLKNESSTPPADMKKLSEEAEDITSMASPLTPPNTNNDMENSISNSLTAEQKVSGGGYGGGRGGSLYASLARTSYTLAPAAALLATAAMVLKGNKHHKRHTRKSLKKTRRNR
jgi:thiol-disulfide isomerase/thioredoxin